MAQAYWAEESGTGFEVFFREAAWQVPTSWPRAGVWSHLEAFRFGRQDLRYLRGLGQFTDEFLRWLAECVSPEMPCTGRDRDFSNEPAVQPQSRQSSRPSLSGVCAEPDSSAKRAREQGRAGGRRARTTGGGFRRAARSQHQRGPCRSRAPVISRALPGAWSARGPPI